MEGGRLREVIAFGGSTVHPFPVTGKEHTFPDILQSFDLYSNNSIEVVYLKRNSRASDKVSKSTCFARMDLNHIINLREKKMIHICCVGRGVKYHSLSYWSISMT